MSLSGDNYANGEGKDLMNEGSFSRLYSFNIYLNFDVIYYHRYYKKLFFIIADGLPFVTGIFSICEIIAKILKISSENEKLIELLFEERQTHESKSIKIENNILEMNQSNNIIENKDISQKDIIYINSPKSQNKRIFQNFQNKNQMISKLNNSNLSSSKLILPNKDRHFTARNNKKIASLFNPQEGLQRENYNVKIDKTVDDKQCKNKKLFPFKYYLYTAFVNNVHKNSSFFSEKFIEV
jgi:DNA-binding protein H-NS